jgi:site-specific recombinase XerD
MITSYFEAPHTLRRLRAPKACIHIDSFAECLARAGYRRWTVRGYLRAAAHFARWADTRGLTPGEFDECAVTRFRDQHLPRCRCIKRNDGKFADAVAGATIFVTHLRDLGVARPAVVRAAEPVPPLIAAFGMWMSVHRGATSSTIAVYTRALRDVLPVIGEDAAAYTPSALRSFVIDHARGRGRGARKTILSALRAFVRFLIATGQCPIGLDNAVPAMAHWRLASLPRHLDAASVERVISVSTSRGESAQQLRDHAVVLLLARLGLRAGDVAALRLDDIDWKGGSLLVRGKGRRESRLPLPTDVGNALAAYIQHGRTEHSDRRVFLRVRAPHRPFASYVAVSDIARRALRHAGVASPQKGAHVFRHSAATAMLRAGSSLETIGAVLRHRSPQTTLHYAKVDVSSLAAIAQAWPEVTSC